MCNNYRFGHPVQRLVDEFQHLRIPLRFPGGLPNFAPLNDIRITDRAPVIRADGDGARLDMMRWSWPSPKGSSVFNVRSEKRRIERAQRCLIPADGFYEFTSAEDTDAKRKDRWLFTIMNKEVFGIAGIWRAGAADGRDAWAMLTCPPGPDIAPFHDRQVVVLLPGRWGVWLSGEANERELLIPSPAEALEVTPA